MKVTTDMVETANLRLTVPSIRLAPSYAGWLRRFAFKQNEIPASVLKNAAEVIDQQRMEIERLGGIVAARDAVVRAAQKWGDTDADDEIAGLASEFELSQALTELAAAVQPGKTGEPQP